MKRWLVLPLLFAACGGKAPPASPPLAPVPEPDLAAADPAVREQLEGQLAEVRRLAAASDRDTGELAGRFGDLGLSYIVYDFLEAAEVCFDNARALAPGDFRWTYLAGYLRQVQGRLPEAIPLLERTLEQEPDYLPAALRLGRARLELGEPEAAEAHFRSALELDPGSAAAHEGLGRAAAARGDDRAAVESFERAVELEPEATGVYYALGQSYRRLGELEKARLALEQGGDVPARIPDPLINPLAAQAQSAQFYLMQGSEALEDRDYETAAGAFGQALELDPRGFTGFRGLAYSLEKMGDLAGAAATLERALAEATTGDAGKDRRERAEVHRLLGGLAVLQGRDEEALASFQRSLELEPEQPVLHLRLANALARAGRFEEAVGHYDRFLELEPETAAAVLEKRATALVNLGRGEEAREDFRRALEAAPEDPALRLRYAAALEHLGDTAAAERQRKRAAELGGEGAERRRLLLERARQRVAAGAYEEAVAGYREALEMAPGSVEAGYELATVLGHLGRYQEAVAEFRGVLATQPRHGAARRGLATALILARRWGEARVELREAQRLSPRDAGLALIQVRLLATAPEPSVRDGTLALEIARRVYQEDQSPVVREAMALALAEAGRTGEAAALQRDLVAAARGAEETRRARARLAAFEAGRAWTAAAPEEILGTPAGR